MTKQWIRSCELTVEAEQGGSGFKFAYAGNPGREGLRIRFRIWREFLQGPDFGEVIVTNPMREVAQALATGGGGMGGIGSSTAAKRFVLKVGYQSGGMKGIFSADVVQVRYGRDSPTDTHLTLTGRSNGRAYDYAYINKTLDAGKTGQDIFDEAAKTMKEFDVSQGDVSPILKQKKYDYPVVLSGHTKDILRSLGRTTGTLWNLQDGKLNMLKPQEPAQGEAVVINAKTGMVGMPEQLKDYIIVRALINPAVELNHRIKLDNNSILMAGWNLGIGGASPGAGAGPAGAWIPPLAQDGIYKVFKIEYVGDTRGNPWYMDMYCVAANMPTPVGEPDFGVGGQGPYTLTPVGSG